MNHFLTASRRWQAIRWAFSSGLAAALAIGSSGHRPLTAQTPAAPPTAEITQPTDETEAPSDQAAPPRSEIERAADDLPLVDGEPAAAGAVLVPPSVTPLISESLSDWSHYSELTLPTPNAVSSRRPTADEGNAGGDVSAAGGRHQPLVAVDVTPHLFAASQRGDLSDLRLFDAAGQPQPLAVRVLAPGQERQTIETQSFDPAVVEGGVHEVTLELTGEFDRHNEVTVIGSGDEFRRRIELLRSDDGANWVPLSSGYLIRFADGQRQHDRHALSYPPSRAKFLKIRVSPDPQNANGENHESFRLQRLEVLHTVQLTGRRSEYPAVLGEREPTRQHGSVASAWLIDLGYDHIPCDRLEFQVVNGEFIRDVALQAEDAVDRLGRPQFRLISLDDSSDWRRSAGGAAEPLAVTFPESTARRYRLIVYDHRNAPLSITSAVASGVTRQLIAPLPAAPAEPWRLYAGNPSAEQPHYDFARGLPAKLAQPPLAASLGEPVANPQYTAPPLPLAQRHPWLVYVAMSVVCGLLLVVILGLSKRALAMSATG